MEVTKTNTKTITQTQISRKKHKNKRQTGEVIVKPWNRNGAKYSVMDGARKALFWRRAHGSTLHNEDASMDLVFIEETGIFAFWSVETL